MQDSGIAGAIFKWLLDKRVLADMNKDYTLAEPFKEVSFGRIDEWVERQGLFRTVEVERS